MQEYTETGNIENALHLPCPSCGNQLNYSAEKKKISCDHCGYDEDVNDSNNLVVEKSLSEALQHVQDFVPKEIGKKVFHCGNCSAKFMVESDKTQFTCGFCGSRNVNLDAFDHQYIQPIGIIPFYVSREEATKKFKKWIKQGAFHPNKLKKLATVDDLHGLYVPFWTYDAQTESSWSGQSGQYYYQNTRVATKTGFRNQSVRQVRWRNRSGHLKHFFDDVLVVASKKLDQGSFDKVLPYRLEEVVNYDARLTMGWETEIYQVEVNEGYDIAERIMDHRLRNMCSAQLGGDTQRNLHVSSQKSSQTYKHIVLPLWICSYTYQNKLYRFVINGQTGRLNGQKPISYIKIGLLILLVMLILFGIWYLRYSGVLQGKFRF